MKNAGLLLEEMSFSANLYAVWPASAGPADCIHPGHARFGAHS